MSSFSTKSVSARVTSPITVDPTRSNPYDEVYLDAILGSPIRAGFHPEGRRLNESESAHRERHPLLGRPPPGARVPRTRRRYRGRTQRDARQTRVRHRRRRSPPRPMRRRANSATPDERSGEINAVRYGTTRVEIGNITRASYPIGVTQWLQTHNSARASGYSY